MSTIAIISGGTSSERQESLNSAKHVMSLLRDRYSVHVYDFPHDRERFLTERPTINLVVPLIHGRGGEDGVLQGFLETLSMPYVFSGVTAHALSIDKRLAKTVVRTAGIPTTESQIITQKNTTLYKHPVAVKQVDGGSSIGVSYADSQETLDAALELLLASKGSALVEPWIVGQEVSVAVVEDQGGIQALPVVLIRPKQGTFFSYEQKYEAETLAEELCPAPISPELTKLVQTLSLAAHVAVGARHASRTDFIIDEEGRPFFLEINTIPGMTETSLLPKMLAAAGTSLAEQLTKWIEETLARALNA